MRIIGLDVLRSVAEIAFLEDGALRAVGRTGLRRDELERFAARLAPDDHVVLEATGNTAAIVNVLRAHADQVIARFPTAEKLVSYSGLKPCVYQTRAQPAMHGRISKRGRSHARATLLEAAWSAAQSPRPLGAFFLRIRNRRGQPLAAVAAARKIAVMAQYVLTRNEAFAWDRPALTARKTCSLELQAGMPARQGGPNGSAAAYNLKNVGDQERAVAEQAERAYQRLFSRWKQARPGKRPASTHWPPT